MDRVIGKMEKKDRSNIRVAVVISRFNKDITDGLLTGACQALTDAGVSRDNVQEFSVPGAFEVPQLAAKLAKTNRFDILVCLGAIIKGETTHDKHLADAVTQGLLRISTEIGIPIGLGIITTLNIEQAKARSTGDKNRGYAAAQAALELLDEFKKL